MTATKRAAVLGGDEFIKELISAIPGVEFETYSPKQKKGEDITLHEWHNGGIDFFALYCGEPVRKEAPLWKRMVAACTKQGVPTLLYAPDVEFVKKTLGSLIISRNIALATKPEEFGRLYEILSERAPRPSVFEIVGSALSDRHTKLPIQALASEPPRGAVRETFAVSDLDSHPLIKSAKSNLRNERSGRLDCQLISSVYGIPLWIFARALDVSKSAVSGTPDSKNYQAFLSYFEKVARIQPLLKDKASFKSWVKAPNEALHGKTPISLLFGSQKDAQRLVDEVEDLLVGQPD